MKENLSFSCWINTSPDQCFLNSSVIVTTSMIGIVYDKDTPAFDTIKHHYASLMLPVAPIPVLWRSLFIKNHANPASHETRRCILD